MKKTIHKISILVLLGSFILPSAVKAQYNNAYFSVWNSMFTSYLITSTARDIVDADPGYQCVLAIHTNLPVVAGQDPTDYLINLKKIAPAPASILSTRFVLGAI